MTREVDLRTWGGDEMDLEVRAGETGLGLRVQGLGLRAQHLGR